MLPLLFEDRNLKKIAIETLISPKIVKFLQFLNSELKPKEIELMRAKRLHNQKSKTLETKSLNSTLSFKIFINKGISKPTKLPVRNTKRYKTHSK